MGLEEVQRPPEAPWRRLADVVHSIDLLRMPTPQHRHTEETVVRPDSTALHPPWYRKALAGSCSERFLASGSLPALQNFHKEKGRREGNGLI